MKCFDIAVSYPMSNAEIRRKAAEFRELLTTWPCAYEVTWSEDSSGKCLHLSVDDAYANDLNATLKSAFGPILFDPDSGRFTRPPILEVPIESERPEES